ncbi:MAG: hypothetical protein ABH851_08270 [Methanobacteriota archaeon]
MNDKTRLKLSLGLLIVFLATTALYLKSSWPLEAKELLTMPIALIIAGFASIFIITNWRSVKSGLPIEDEYTRRLAHKAGYYTWLITIYIALGVGWVADDIPGFAPRHGATAVLLLSALTYFIVYFYLKMRGDS